MNMDRTIMKMVRATKIGPNFLAAWEGFFDGKVKNAMVIILRTRGCRWSHLSGCTMCGYFKETYDAGYEELKEQIDYAFDRYNREEIVKFFTSGSFFDEREIPFELQEYALEKFGNAEKIIVETRPEFVKNAGRFDYPLEIAMGLESANDRVLEYSINKGFRFKPWLREARKVKEYGKRLRVYILIKPPFMKEREAIEDAVNAAFMVKDIADTISFNPMAVHGGTAVEGMWSRNIYRPPWLWSVVEVIKRTGEFYDGMIKCDVVAGGKSRGAHNCMKCDKDIIHAIEEFNLSQDIKVFDKLDCECREKWLDFIEMEEYMMG